VVNSEVSVVVRQPEENMALVSNANQSTGRNKRPSYNAIDF
jgi:hypothetical protein